VTDVLDGNSDVHIIQCMLNYLPDLPTPPIDLDHMAKWLKVLAEPNRLLIFNFIMGGVQCNCELGSNLDMAPNLISHHLRVLREAGLVDVERDAQDARWMYYSINRRALEELNRAWGAFFDLERIKPRRLTCGPQGEFIRLDLVNEG
jgi:ArsR family transcriptional regulator